MVGDLIMLITLISVALTAALVAVSLRDRCLVYEGCRHVRRCPLCGYPLASGERGCPDCGWTPSDERKIA